MSGTTWYPVILILDTKIARVNLTLQEIFSIKCDVYDCIENFYLKLTRQFCQFFKYHPLKLNQ